MKMNPRSASLLAIFIASTPVLSAGEIERLRALVAEQEMQIQQLELKVAQLSAPAPAQVSAPVSQPTATPETSAETKAESSTYTVKAGDNTVSIARQYGISTAALNKLNNLKSDDIIRPGQKLKVPSSNKTVSKEKTSTTTPETKAVSNSIKHKVSDTDTFFSISKKYNVTIDALKKENPNINPKTLHAGQTVQIPKKPEVSTPTAEEPKTASSDTLTSNQPKSTTQLRASDKPIKITKEISYSDFAKNHNTTPSRLDEINGLRLDPSTVLAKGSELYVPE